MAEAETDLVATVRDGYAFDGPCVELGALVVDGMPGPMRRCGFHWPC